MVNLNETDQTILLSDKIKEFRVTKVTSNDDIPPSKVITRSNMHGVKPEYACYCD